MKVLHEAHEQLPAYARAALHTIGTQLRVLASEVDRLETQILAWHRANEASRRLATIPGIGPDHRVGVRSAEFIRASSHAVLHEQAEHMDAPDRAHLEQKPLASQGPSTHGSTATSSHSYAGEGPSTPSRQTGALFSYKVLQ
jgi:hypothetical protein